MGLMVKGSGGTGATAAAKRRGAVKIGSIRVAIPSMWPGGLTAMRSGHFGRCDCFTLVDLDDGGVKAVRVVPNPPHDQGGCLAPVSLLEEHRAAAIIVQGIGMRPLMGFRQAGIEVYLGQGRGVRETVLAFLDDAIPVIDESQACGG